MNEHILNYCKGFITSDESPRFAVFIKGPWGCGKTYFINKLIDNLDSNYDKKRIVKISLFGVSSADEIDVKIYEALHPLLSSNGAKIAGTIFKAVLKLGFSVSIGNEGKSVAISPNDFSFSNSTNHLTDDKVIIVDDFERALMPSESILGYFSNLISDSDNRVIFIGNEERVRDRAEFNIIKEKTIGMEFLIVPDYKAAIDSFAEEIIKDIKARAIVKNTLLEVNDVLNCSNLRIIRQAFYNFDLLIDGISIETSFDLSLLSKPFFILFIQKSLGIIENKDAQDALSAFFNKRMRLDSYIKEKEAHKSDAYWDLFFSLSGYETVLPVSDWEEIVFDGRFNKKCLETGISDFWPFDVLYG